jgi:hypothetical protein
MTQKVFTFREAAEAFCALDGRPDSDVTAVYLQVKGLYDRGLMAALPERGARGAHQITLAEACRARLLIVLVDLGVESDDLERANIGLNRGGQHTFPDGKILKFSLESVINAAKDAKQPRWVLRLHMGRVQGGKLSFSSKLMPAWLAARPIKSTDTDGLPPGDPTHPESESASGNLAYIKIPASELIAPLLKDADA